MKLGHSRFMMFWYRIKESNDLLSFLFFSIRVILTLFLTWRPSTKRIHYKEDFPYFTSTLILYSQIYTKHIYTPHLYNSST